MLRSMLWIGGFILLGKLVAAAKELVVAAGLGTGPMVDQYLLAFNLANLPVGLSLSVLSIVLIPLAARLRHGSTEQLRLFRRELLGWAITCGFSFGALLWAFFPNLLQIGISAGSEKQLNVLPLCGLIPLGVVSSVLSTWLLASERHVNSLLDAAPSTFLFMALVLIGCTGSVLVWGTVAGYGIQLLLLALLLWRSRELETPRLSMQAAGWESFRRGFGLILIGQAAMVILPVVDQFFAGNLGQGAIASLGYANRLLALFVGLGAISISRASLPIISRLEAQGNSVSHHIRDAVLIILIGSSVCILVAWLLTPWGVALLFERGAFTSQDTVNVATVFRWNLLQLPFYYSWVFLTVVLAAKGRHGVIVWISLMHLMLKLSANVLLVKSFGLPGLVAASAPIYALSAGLGFFLLQGFGKRTPT